jgi:hypothetical protein
LTFNRSLFLASKPAGDSTLSFRGLLLDRAIRLVHTAVDFIQTGIELALSVAAEAVEFILALLGPVGDLLALGAGIGDLWLSVSMA